MRQCAVVILMVLFFLQVVPVRKVGKITGKVQGTEQMQQDSDDDSDDDCPDSSGYSSDVVLPGYITLITRCPGNSIAKVLSFHNSAEILLSALVTKIPSPPPEC